MHNFIDSAGALKRSFLTHRLAITNLRHGAIRTELVLILENLVTFAPFTRTIWSEQGAIHKTDIVILGTDVGQVGHAVENRL